MAGYQSFRTFAANLGVHDGVPAARPTSAMALRCGLVIGCTAAVLIAAQWGDPSAYLQADPALARLLRGMALIKSLLASGAIGVVFWRLAWPVSTASALTYVIGCGLLSGSTMLIWELSYIPFAAFLFHAAALSMLVVGWRDRR